MSSFDASHRKGVVVGVVMAKSVGFLDKLSLALS